MNYQTNWLPFDFQIPTAGEWAAEYAKRGLEYRKAIFFLLVIGLIVPFTASYLILYFTVLITYIVCAALLWRKQICFENLSKLDISGSR